MQPAKLATRSPSDPRLAPLFRPEHAITPCRRLSTVLLNSNLAALFTSLLRSAALTSLRLRLTTLLALLLRHTTYVSARLARGELLTALATALRDRTDKVRRRAAAALGGLEPGKGTVGCCSCTRHI